MCIIRTNSVSLVLANIEDARVKGRSANTLMQES